MSRNGSGVYSLPAGNPVVTGTTISSSWANTTLSDIATALTGSVAADGQTAMTGNLQMGNNKVTGLAVATSSGDALSYGQAATISALTVSGAAALNGGITVDTNAFIVADTTGSITTAGNLTFTGTSNRITGDLTNATLSNRLMFQNSVSNGASNVQVLPNGTGTTAGFLAYANSDPTNTNFCAIQAIGSGIETRINSGITGTGTYAPITMLTGGSERLRIDTSGNVGIGTSSPTQKLQINDAGNVTIQLTKTGVASFTLTNNGTSGTVLNVESVPMIFNTSNTERMRITSSGNVGIGTSSPTQKLQINDAGNVTIQLTKTGVASFTLTNNGTSGTVLNVESVPMIFNTSNTERMRITSSGDAGIGTTSPQARLEVAGGGIKVKGYSATSVTDGLNVQIGVAGSIGYVQSLSNTVTNDLSLDGSTIRFRVGSFTEAMRIDSSGNLLVGTTSASAGNIFGSGILTRSTNKPLGVVCDSNSGSAAIGVGRTNSTGNYVEFYYGGAGTSFVGGISTNGSSTAYNTTSDYRLKENIAPMTGALAKVQALKPVTYDWKAGGSSEGFIAHELAEVCPDAVTGEKDAVNEDGSIKPQGIDTSFLVATLTAAIQEQQAIINDLKARIETLESK